MNPENFPDKITRAQLELMNTFRLLWEQHDVWTRATISSLVFALPDVEPVVARLLRNPEDFEMGLSPFYGRRTAAQFRELLQEHLLLTADIITASKEGDEEAAQEAKRLWYANAEAIADFLSSINPFWSRRLWQRMMFAHLDLVLEEAVTMLRGDYQVSVSVYDEIELQSLMMADEMSRGIIAQFHIR